jgi:hypothetical protein
VIEQKMEFNGPFGLTKFGPVKQTQAQIDHGRVQTEELVLETEALTGSKILRQIQQAMEDAFIELPGSMGIGVAERGTAGTIFQAQVSELSFATGQAINDLA